MRSPVGLAQPSEEFELTGFTQGQAMAFTVHFGRHTSLTAWVGHHLIEDGEGWRAVWAGADVFRRGAAPTGMRPRRGGPLPPLWSD
jgi:hypothetical protein